MAGARAVIASAHGSPIRSQSAVVPRSRRDSGRRRSCRARGERGSRRGQTASARATGAGGGFSGESRSREGAVEGHHERSEKARSERRERRVGSRVARGERPARPPRLHRGQTRPRRRLGGADRFVAGRRSGDGETHRARSCGTRAIRDARRSSARARDGASVHGSHRFTRDVLGHRETPDVCRHRHSPRSKAGTPRRLRRLGRGNAPRLPARARMFDAWTLVGANYLNRRSWPNSPRVTHAF